MEPSTVDAHPTAIPSRGPAIPGVVLLCSGGELAQRAAPLRRGRLVVGRDRADALDLADERVSRAHVELHREHGRWTITDLGSRNGTQVDGLGIVGSVTATAGTVVRVGRTVLMLCDDVRAWEGWSPGSPRDPVIGPRMRPLLDALARAAGHGDPVFIGGETGTGKELAAAVYHRGTGRAKPMVAINCAAIPASLAERLLFGARKGAYSGATDAQGLFEAADGGTVFLDEVAELDLAVQAKLLRVLESGELLPLGSTVPRRVDVRVCCASHHELGQAVTHKRFREDLYYRLARARVRLPPLRCRREDIALLVGHALARHGAGLRAHERLIEHCCVQPWRGNLRELLGELDAAIRSAHEAGSELVRIEHLPVDEAAAIVEPVSPAAVDHDAIVAALGRSQGNLAAAARALGLHRTQLYRLLEQRGIDPRKRE